MARTSTALVATSDAQAERMVEPYSTAVSALAAGKAELASMRPSAIKAALALDYSRQVKAVLARYDKSELRQQILSLHRAHRFFTSMVHARLLDPADDFLAYCSGVRADWEIERRRRIEEGRRQRENQLKLDMEVERQGQVDHLKTLGRTDEAEALAAEPLQPVSVSVDTEAGKPTDEMMVEFWRPQTDAHGDVQFSDLGAYLRWIAENPAFYYLVDHKFGELKKLLTENRGLLQPPGLLVEHRFEPRTRLRSTDASGFDEEPDIAEVIEETE